MFPVENISIALQIQRNPLKTLQILTMDCHTSFRLMTFWRENLFFYYTIELSNCQSTTVEFRNCCTNSKKKRRNKIDQRCIQVDVFKSTLSKQLVSSRRYQLPTVCKIQNAHFFLPLLFDVAHKDTTRACLYTYVLKYSNSRNLHRSTKAQTNDCMRLIRLNELQNKAPNKPFWFICDRLQWNCMRRH